MIDVSRRISIVGNSGSGKTSLARRAAAVLDVPHIELDAIYHQPGWQALETSDFRRRVEVATEIEGWVSDGNYMHLVGDLVWRRADTVVWLDLPRRRVMRQVAARTFRRVVRREELWNGNREPWSNLYRWDPTTNIVRWAWTQHEHYRARYETAMAQPWNAHLRFVHVRSHSEADAWLASLAATPRS
jgi:adenylate kinase family enzyme